MNEPKSSICDVTTIAHNGRPELMAEHGPIGSYDAYFDCLSPENPEASGRITEIKKHLGKRTKVALVGFSDPAKAGCPWDDPTWEIFSLNQHYRHSVRASRWFEIHTRKQYLSDTVPGTDYLKWLQECPLPIYVTELLPDMPTAIRWPMDEIVARAGIFEEVGPGQYEPRDYIQSSLAVMLAVALLEGFDTIGIWGVDLIVGTEYFYQKPNMEWLLGYAQGLGYTVTRGTVPRGVPREIFIPDASALLRQTYSYGKQTKDHNFLRPLMQDRKTAIDKGLAELAKTLDQIDGELQANLRWIQLLEFHAQGQTVDWTHSDGRVEAMAPGTALQLMRLRQEHCLQAKKEHLETYQQAEGEMKGLFTWLNLLEIHERGGAAKWQWSDGVSRPVTPPK